MLITTQKTTVPLIHLLLFPLFLFDAAADVTKGVGTKEKSHRPCKIQTVEH